MGNKGSIYHEVSELLDNPANQAKLMKVFKQIDKDRSGSLSPAEFTKLGKALVHVNLQEVKKSGDYCTHEAIDTQQQIATFIDSIFKLADTNRDGELSFDEFMTFIHSHSQQSATQRIQQQGWVLQHKNAKKIDRDIQHTHVYADAKKMTRTMILLGPNQSAKESFKQCMFADVPPTVCNNDFAEWNISIQSVAFQFVEIAEQALRKKGVFDQIDEDRVFLFFPNLEAPVLRIKEDFEHYVELLQPIPNTQWLFCTTCLVPALRPIAVATYAECFASLRATIASDHRIRVIGPDLLVLGDQATSPLHAFYKAISDMILEDLVQHLTI